MTTSVFQLTSEQDTAIDRVLEYLNSPRHEFTLGGYAGTGKTTVVSVLMGHLREKGMAVTVLAPTGKAAQVLVRKGVKANTIHSFLYNYRGKRKVDEQEKQRRLEASLTDDDIVVPTKRFEPIFEGKADIPDSGDLVIIDESSMVNRVLYNDLQRHDLKILFVGDHGQLPPVGGDPGIMRRLDARLETIHRQAAENPILRIAHHVRQGGSPLAFAGGEADGPLKVGKAASPRRIVSVALERQFDQIIVGKNRTRHAINREYRRAIGNPSDETVCVGERVICLRNNHGLGIMNGEMFTVTEVHSQTADYITVEIVPEGEPEASPREVQMVKASFLDEIEKLSDDEADRLAEGDLFDYGYAITAHKSQGSEWSSVLVVDEAFGEKDRWRYTAYTRAKDRLAVALL